jgi:hypothetical protein
MPGPRDRDTHELGAAQQAEAEAIGRRHRQGVVLPQEVGRLGPANGSHLEAGRHERLAGRVAVAPVQFRRPTHHDLEIGDKRAQ